MKSMRFTLLLALLTMGAYAKSPSINAIVDDSSLESSSLLNNRVRMIRETYPYEDSCGNHWTLIIHFQDQGNATDNNNERFNHISALTDQLESNCATQS